MDAGLIECRPSESDLCGSKVNKLCRNASGPNHHAPPFKLTNYFLDAPHEFERKTKQVWIYRLLFTAGVLGRPIFGALVCIFFSLLWLKPLFLYIYVPQTDFPGSVKCGKIR